MSYETLASFAQTWGVLYFVAMFAGATAYALWPSNRDTFKRAAIAPLKEREADDDRPLA
ncbi:CcoQ/FixQ family Cbb3-type cytochrome c oxidase assembly chaperone [bacterium]|nr:CcoQ/FixQ family Cbb3-type cytochrome c oxidase assembly chaperone [bacterium]